MPHDADGSPLKVGDSVIIRAVVKTLDQNETACNATFEFVDIAAIGEYRPVVCCNTRLVEKVVPSPALLLSPNCDRPPAGWYCTRESGHDGPCAAWPHGECVPIVQ